MSFIICLLLSFILINKSVIKQEEKTISYSENSNVDYLVYLKENDFYDEPYLEPNMNYVASLIKYISVFFDYNFTSSEKINTTFYYDISAKLEITDSKGEKEILSKEYQLLTQQVLTQESSSNASISRQTVDIDYNYYNEIAQNFKKQYGVESISNLIVTMNVKKMTDTDFNGFNQIKKISLTIPLTQKAINIKLTPNEDNNNAKIVTPGGYEITNKTESIFSGLLLLISLFIIYRIYKLLLLLLPKRTELDKEVKKILKTYDRLIANVATFPDLNEYNVIKVKDFNELVDIRDNLKRPIFYFNVKKGEKCHFYIMEEKTIYLLTLKNVDLINENEK